MIVKTRIFGLSHNHYKNLSQLAKAMEISISQIYRVRQGKRQINQRFIVGAITAFPGHRFEDLFYLAPEMPCVTSNHRHDSSYIDEEAAKENLRKKSTLQTVGELDKVLSHL